MKNKIAQRVWLTSAEKKLLESLSLKEGISQSDFVGKLILAAAGKSGKGKSDGMGKVEASLDYLVEKMEMLDHLVEKVEALDGVAERVKFMRDSTRRADANATWLRCAISETLPAESKEAVEKQWQGQLSKNGAFFRAE